MAKLPARLKGILSSTYVTLVCVITLPHFLPPSYILTNEPVFDTFNIECSIFKIFWCEFSLLF